MALVNVGVELARLGKRVLLVDFDLEAPSLTSFNLEAAASCGPGIVEYVNEYLKTDRAPNVREFVSKPQLFPSGGALWVMPSGDQGDGYQNKLAQINWLDLYENRAGYLLVEEMKAQWKAQLSPDYVLVDSRTGHSDVSGICTRQLPNAVCFVFVPNRQNLDGLSRTVQQVRAANVEESARAIEMFFVESNVPYYDDERRTLHKNRGSFLERLNVDDFDATLHQHPHLSVLNQSVFVEEFPDTSLASEYRELTETLRRGNLSDRDAVLPQLQRMAKDLRVSRGSAATAANAGKLAKISNLHGTDAEICFWLGRISRQLGELENALIQLNRAVELGYRKPDVYLERASLRLSERNDTSVQEAIADLRAALDLLASQPKYGDVLFAVRNLLSIAPGQVDELSASPAIQALSVTEQIAFADEMNTSDEANELAYSVLKRIRGRDDMPREVRVNWSIGFGMTCIRRKSFSEAIEALEGESTSPEEEQTRLFNLGVARWAKSGVPPKSEFEQVLQLHEKLAERRADQNYLQCLAIASYVNGDRDQARRFVDRARKLAERTPSQQFSAWRYLKVSPRKFIADCATLSEQIEQSQELRFPAIEGPEQCDLPFTVEPIRH
jgi:tetratricopeptide (TPR) repeat protein